VFSSGGLNGLVSGGTTARPACAGFDLSPWLACPIHFPNIVNVNAALAVFAVAIGLRFGLAAIDTAHATAVDHVENGVHHLPPFLAGTHTGTASNGCSSQWPCLDDLICLNDLLMAFSMVN